MGYLLLSAALICGAVKGYCGKKTSNSVTTYFDAMTASLLRVAFCAVIGITLIIISGDYKGLLPDIQTMLICALSGISTSVMIITWLLAIRRGAYMLLDVFLMAGVILPIILGIFAFEERVSIKEWIGIALLIAATLIMCSYSSAIKNKLDIISIVLLILCGVSNGMCDFSQKLFIKSADGVSISVFNLYTYIFSAVTILLVFLVSRLKSQEKNKNPKFNIKGVIGYIGIMAVCLFAYSYLKTGAAQFLDSAELYPLSQGASLIISSVMAAVLFGEKITAKCVIGLVLAFSGLIVINVL